VSHGRGVGQGGGGGDSPLRWGDVEVAKAGGAAAFLNDDNALAVFDGSGWSCNSVRGGRR
jgi:hypothetical protein